MLGDGHPANYPPTVASIGRLEAQTDLRYQSFSAESNTSIVEAALVLCTLAELKIFKVIIGFTELGRWDISVIIPWDGDEEPRK